MPSTEILSLMIRSREGFTDLFLALIYSLLDLRRTLTIVLEIEGSLMLNSEHVFFLEARISVPEPPL